MYQDSIAEQTTSVQVPRLYIWNGEILFLGTANVPLRAHRVVQEKFLVCLEGKFRLPDQNGDMVSSRSCLIGNGIRLERARIDGRGTVVAMTYLVPFSQDYPAMASHMTCSSPGVYYGHPNEQQLISKLTGLRDGPRRPEEQAYRILKDLMIPEAARDLRFRDFDPRILDIASRIRSNMEDNLSTSRLADGIGLSRSRLEKLFKKQTGIPLTLYRTRCRVFTAVVLLGLGHSVTEAALMTGFSSTAHFSRLFGSINGFSPSTIFQREPQPETMVETDTARAALAQSRELLVI